MTIGGAVWGRRTDREVGEGNGPETISPWGTEAHLQTAGTAEGTRASLSWWSEAGPWCWANTCGVLDAL